MHIYHFAPPNKKQTNNKHIIKVGGFSPTYLNKKMPLFTSKLGEHLPFRKSGPVILKKNYRSVIGAGHSQDIVPTITSIFLESFR